MGRRKRQAKSAPREPHMPGPEGEVVDPWWLPIPIVLAVLAVYANSLSGAFLLDDQIMLHRPWVQSLAQWQTLLAHSPRPVVDFTFAVNHALGGTGTVGYHMINVAVHLAAALTLFGLVRRTLGTAGLRERFCGSAGWIAWSVALIWAVHPVNTQAVTYIVQRAESMMGLFYLLMLYALLRGATATSGRVLWYLAAIAASWLGMGSKGVMVTAPFVALMYDRAFLSTSMRAVLVARGWVHGLIWVSLLGLYLTGVAPSVLKTEASARASVGFAYQEVTPMAYALTQPGVLLHYVKLSLLPIGQCLDYDWPIAKGLGSSWPSLLTVGVFVAATVLAWRRRPALGFVGLWFFVILAPTSSFIPIKDAAFEHRMYLPLVAIVTIVVLLGHALIRRVPLGGPSPGAVWARYGSVFAAVVAVLLCGVSMARNTVYANRVTIWTDVVHKRPDNNRARSNLGLAYMEERKFAKAESVFREGIRRDPQHTNYYLNLSKVLSILGRYEDAQDALKEAARIEPERAETQYNLGVVLTRLSGQHADAPQALEQLEQAAEAFRAALRLKPQLDPARTNLQKATRDLIKAHLQEGRIDAALAACRASLQVLGDDAAMHAQLGALLERTGRVRQALEAYRRAAQLDPADPRVHVSIGSALLQLERFDEAVEAFDVVVALGPDVVESNLLAEACFYAAVAQMRQGLTVQAVSSLEAALRANPNHSRARQALTDLQRQGTQE